MLNFQLPWWTYPVILIDLVLRGIALWRSAKKDEKYWFVALLVLNTAGILPLVYLIYTGYFKKENKKKKAK